MEEIENDNVVVPRTTTNNSDFTGAPVNYGDEREEGLRLGELKTVCDHNDFTGRMFDFLYSTTGSSFVSYGPAAAPLSLYSFSEFLQKNNVTKMLLDYYTALSWKSVTFRFSLSNPKGIAGGLVVGSYPWSTWNATPFSSEAGYHDLNPMTRQRLMLAPESHLMSYGQGDDVIFTVPWQYNTSLIMCRDVLKFDRTSFAKLPLPGTPTLFICPLAAQYVTSVTGPAQVRIFVTFEELTFQGPMKSDVYNIMPQSGVEPAIAMGAAIAVDAAVSTGAEILKAAMGNQDEFFDDSEINDSYTRPSAVQLSYVGDSTSVGCPPTAPIFRPWLGSSSKHKVIDYLRKPQFIHVIDTSVNDRNYFANPLYPFSGASVPSDNMFASFFTWFAQVNSFWRGTIRFHFRILSHPMVQVKYIIRTIYPPKTTISTDDDPSLNQMLQGICAGDRHIVVPMPYLTPLDYIPLSEGNVSHPMPSALSVNFQVVSSMLSVAPTIPIAVFISAGEDFSFFQPYPVGLGYVEPEEFNIVPQISLGPVDEVCETRALVQEPVHTLPSMTYVEDYMKIWSRCLPYEDFDNEAEPQVNLVRSVDPFWWPVAVGGTDPAHTLDVNNSWWVTNDYVSFLSSPYLYFSGSIALKVLCEDSLDEYKYITMRLPFSRGRGHCPYTYSPTMVPAEANFGFGSVLTPASKQPVLDVTIPSRSTFAYGFCNPQVFVAQTVNTQVYNSKSNGILDTNVILHEPESDLKDAAFRKAGDDYSVFVFSLLPPPTLWCSRGNHWS